MEFFEINLEDCFTAGYYKCDKDITHSAGGPRCRVCGSSATYVETASDKKKAVSLVKKQGTNLNRRDGVNAAIGF